MAEFSIRPVRDDDLPWMGRIARRTIDRCYRAFLGDESVDWYISSGESDRELREHVKRCDVVLIDDAIVAFAIYFDDLIHLMMVDVDMHRSGIGSALLLHSETQLFARGNRVIRLETFDGNRQAIDFYLKHGWTITRREPDQQHAFMRVLFEKHAPAA